MLPTSAGVEPTTSWSPVRLCIQLSHRGQQNTNRKYVKVTNTEIKWSIVSKSVILIIFVEFIDQLIDYPINCASFIQSYENILDIRHIWIFDPRCEDAKNFTLLIGWPYKTCVTSELLFQRMSHGLRCSVWSIVARIEGSRCGSLGDDWDATGNVLWLVSNCCFNFASAIATDKRGYPQYFSYFSMKTYVVGTH